MLAGAVQLMRVLVHAVVDIMLVVAQSESRSGLTRIVVETERRVEHLLDAFLWDWQRSPVPGGAKAGEVDPIGIRQDGKENLIRFRYFTPRHLRHALQMWVVFSSRTRLTATQRTAERYARSTRLDRFTRATEKNEKPQKHGCAPR